MLPGDQRQQQRVREAVCRERDKGSSLTIFLDLKHQPPNQPTNQPSNMFNNVEVGQDGAASQGDQESRGSLAWASWEASPLRTLTQPGLQICPPLSHSCPFSTSLPFSCQPSWRGSPFGGRSSFSSAGDLVLCTARPLSCLQKAARVSLFSDSCLVNMNKENSGDREWIGQSSDSSKFLKLTTSTTQKRSILNFSVGSIGQGDIWDAGHFLKGFGIRTRAGQN